MYPLALSPSLCHLRASIINPPPPRPTRPVLEFITVQACAATISWLNLSARKQDWSQAAVQRSALDTRKQDWAAVQRSALDMLKS